MPTFATTTAYGRWLPGDARGWIRDGRLLPANASFERHAQKIMLASPISFSPEDQNRLLVSICAASREFGYKLCDLSIESWHLHWIIIHDDPIESMMGRLKNRMRQMINRGRIWTEGYCANALLTDHALGQARAYIAKHRGCRIWAGNFREGCGVVSEMLEGRHFGRDDP